MSKDDMTECHRKTARARNMWDKVSQIYDDHFLLSRHYPEHKHAFKWFIALLVKLRLL